MDFHGLGAEGTGGKPLVGGQPELSWHILGWPKELDWCICGIKSGVEGPKCDGQKEVDLSILGSF